MYPATFLLVLSIRLVFFNLLGQSGINILLAFFIKPITFRGNFKSPRNRFNYWTFVKHLGVSERIYVTIISVSMVINFNNYAFYFGIYFHFLKNFKLLIKNYTDSYYCFKYYALCNILSTVKYFLIMFSMSAMSSQLNILEMF